MNLKLCPLSNGNDIGEVMCIKEKCAWWSVVTKKCAILVIAEK